MSQLNFDASTVAPNSGMPDPIPAGWYNAMIDESEMKPTKDKEGSYLELRLTVIDGQFAGRKIFDRLNLMNKSAVAQEIGNGTLSAICHATGVMQLQDSQQLHGQPMKIKVKLKAASGDYEASNEIGSYKNINEQVGAGEAAAVGQAPVQANVQVTPPAQSQPPAGWAQSQQPATEDPVLMAEGLNYAEHITAGWTDESLIANGKATAKAPAAVTPPPVATPPPAATVAAPPAVAQPPAANTVAPAPTTVAPAPAAAGAPPPWVK